MKQTIDYLKELFEEPFELIEGSIEKDFYNVIRAAQEDVIKWTVEECAESAQIRFWDGHFQEGKLLKHFQSGINNLTVSKESILSVADKLIKEL